MNDDTPKTLLEAVTYFSDPAVTFKAMFGAKWPDGKIACPKCNGEAVGVITSRSMLQCKAKDCRKQFSCKVGTIFEDSPLGLDKWFVAVWCIANAKNGISSCELARALGVTQKTAWFMLHRIRLAMKTKPIRSLVMKYASGEEPMVGDVVEVVNAGEYADDGTLKNGDVHTIKVLSYMLVDSYLPSRFKLLRRADDPIPPVDVPMTEPVERTTIRSVCDDLRETLLRKNSDYGSSVFNPPVLNTSLSAESAIHVRLSDKFARLSNLLSSQKEAANESIEDTFLDIAGYCVLELVRRKLAAELRKDAT